MAEDSTNALGLEFSQLNVQEKQEAVVTQKDESNEQTDPQDPSAEAAAAAKPATPSTNNNRKEREKPYVNPERVKTGGSQREKLSEEELKERMARIREQNEKIKQRRLDVQADEDAFRKTQEVERARQAQSRKIQSDIDRARDQNAKRKLDKVQSREWDSGKPSVDRHRQYGNRSQAGPASEAPPESVGEATQHEHSESTTAEGNADSGNWTRGGPRGRGRGRGAGNRGRGNNRREYAKPGAASETSATEENPPSASS